MTFNSKSIKISSKGQITIPKTFLDQIGLSNGQNVIIEYINDKIQITNKKKLNQQKLLNFKPISIGTNKKVDFSTTHNDIYD